MVAVLWMNHSDQEVDTEAHSRRHEWKWAQANRIDIFTKEGNDQRPSPFHPEREMMTQMWFLFISITKKATEMSGPKGKSTSENEFGMLSESLSLTDSSSRNLMGEERSWESLIGTPEVTCKCSLSLSLVGRNFCRIFSHKLCLQHIFWQAFSFALDFRRERGRRETRFVMRYSPSHPPRMAITVMRTRRDCNHYPHPCQRPRWLWGEALYCPHTSSSFLQPPHL